MIRKMASLTATSRILSCGGAGREAAVIVICFSAGMLVSGCGRGPNATAAPDKPKSGEQPLAVSADCRSCHEEIYRAWADSHHAQAHRPVAPAADADAFQPARAFVLHDVEYRIAWEQGRPAFSETPSGRLPEHFTAEFVLGYAPLRQYIVPVGGGRYQAAELAFDPRKKEWFDVFGEEQRQPGEWGHWRGRGMNWNSMCAQCHLTDFRRNYDAQTDSYASTWREHGIGCLQCHGELAPEHGRSPAKPEAALAPPTTVARLRAQETCAPCHARNEFLTGDIQPGRSYADHHRLTLPVEPGVFFPDGQMRDEDFNYTSFLTSRMGGKAGVTCLDCHDPHSGKTLLPADNNLLCLQCHAAPGRLHAPGIDPVAHSHHGLDSTGNRCVACHMPTTVFMQRDPRHDHGFLRPDPLLTKELSIPNACNRCHTDQSADWAIAATTRWYGATMESRQRERTRAVAAAQAEVPGGATALLALIATEEVPAWKATLLLLTRAYVADPAVAPVARSALTDLDPLVRSAAVQVLGTRSDEAERLRPRLKDPVRLVRLDAEWALSAELPERSGERQELDAYLSVGADQPAGRLRQGQDLFNRGRMAEAEAPLRLAVAWDPNSPGIHEALGAVLHALGREVEAAGEDWRAAQLVPADANAAFRAALAFAGAGKMADAELALRETIRRNPQHDRAWYNLGLLLAQTDRSDDALEALRKAESIAPVTADYPYAAATVLWQRGDRAGAAAAARRALAIDPQHEPARDFLRRTGG